MAKKQYEILDGDGFANYQPYKSKCPQCRHFDVIKLACGAFPDGILAEFLSGDKVHDKVVKKQANSDVFTPF